jgi:hypothetical protein
MKNSIKTNRLLTIFIGVAIFCSISACKKGFLDQVPFDRITIEQIFMRQKYSEEYLANIYNYIPNEAYRNTTIWDGASDDADITYDRPGSGYDSYPINLGNWNASSNYYNKWLAYYRGIRSATYFIQHIGANAEMLAQANGQERITQYIAEARALRATFYYNLVRQYGPVVLVGDDVISGDLSPSDEEANKPRSSFDECISYIVSELELAAKDLKKNYTDQVSTDYGRMTQAVCFAYESKALLLAASPQFNGNPDYANFKNKDGKALVSTQYDANKWKLAADAANKIITNFSFALYRKNNAAGSFDPYLSTRDVFLDAWNPEVVFARVSNNLSSWEKSVGPRIVSGYGAVAITQQLIDEFETSTGKRINQTGTDYVETGFATVATKYTTVGTYNMYVNREPRFYVNVSYNGSQWLYTGEGIKIVETFFSGNTGKKGSYDYPRTGYIARKNVDPNSNIRTAVYVARPFVMIRFAEILLNYIEALNEYDPGNADITKYLNQIRNRAGLPNVQVGLGQSEMRERIRHERRVELCLEGYRYTDTRRWKIADQTDGGPFYGMNVDAGTKLNDEVFYQRTMFERRIFLKQYYLFPIPQDEMDRDKNMVQNPGW